MGAPSNLATTMPWPEKSSTAQTTATIPPLQVTSWLDANLSHE
jgi:hypothetical protein